MIGATTVVSESRFLRRSLSLIALLVVVALVARLLPGERIIDDSYITYRYAANVANGVGFVYNAGERVLGTTTPLYTLILAIAYGITGASLPSISVLLNATFDGIGVMLLFLLASRVYGNWVPAFALSMLWAVAPRSVTFAVGGLETSLYVTLILAAFLAYLDERSIVASALTGLAVLTRPDALIWAGPLAVAMIIQRWRVTGHAKLARRLPWTELLVFLAIMLPWIVFGSLTFGSPLSNSVAAKSVSYQLPATQGLSAVIQTMATPFFEFDAFGSWGAIVGSVVYLVLSLFGAMFTIHDDRRVWPLVLFPWLHVIAFAAANPLIFRWYLTPMLPIYTLLLMGGVWGGARRAGGEIIGSVFVGVVGVFWLVLSLNAWVIHPDTGPDRPARIWRGSALKRSTRKQDVIWRRGLTLMQP